MYFSTCEDTFFFFAATIFAYDRNKQNENNHQDCYDRIQVIFRNTVGRNTTC